MISARDVTDSCRCYNDAIHCVGLTYDGGHTPAWNIAKRQSERYFRLQLTLQFLITTIHCFVLSSCVKKKTKHTAPSCVSKYFITSTPLSPAIATRTSQHAEALEKGPVTVGLLVRWCNESGCGCETGVNNAKMKNQLMYKTDRS